MTRIEDKEYTEKEITEVIERLHSFHEPVFLRRALIDYKYLLRDKEGRVYRKNSEKLDGDRKDI